MKARPRHRNGTFKSCFDAEIERAEAKWNAEIQAFMDAGLEFNEAWLAAGGEIIPTTASNVDDAREVDALYETVRRRH